MDLAAISHSRILSLKEAYTREERIESRARHFTFESKNSFSPV